MILINGGSPYPWRWTEYWKWKPITTLLSVLEIFTRVKTWCGYGAKEMSLKKTAVMIKPLLNTTHSHYGHNSVWYGSSPRFGLGCLLLCTLEWGPRATRNQTSMVIRIAHRFAWIHLRCSNKHALSQGWWRCPLGLFISQTRDLNKVEKHRSIIRFNTHILFSNQSIIPDLPPICLYQNKSFRECLFACYLF